MGDRAKTIAKAPVAKREQTDPQRRRCEGSFSGVAPFGHVVNLQKTIGNHAMQRLFKSGRIQEKLKIGAPNDVYEQEADRVADQVMRMTEREAVGRGVKGEEGQGGGQWMGDGGLKRDTLQQEPG